MESIIVSIISVIGSFIVIYLTSVKEIFLQKNKIRREQLDNFYIPFYRMYCQGFMSINKLSTFSVETRCEFLDLFTNNIHLMESKSQSMFSAYYRAFLDMLEVDAKNPDYSEIECKDRLDEIFDLMSSVILNEYKRILKKCHLPVPYTKAL